MPVVRRYTIDPTNNAMSELEKHLLYRLLMEKKSTIEITKLRKRTLKNSHYAPVDYDLVSHIDGKEIIYRVSLTNSILAFPNNGEIYVVDKKLGAGTFGHVSRITHFLKLNSFNQKVVIEQTPVPLIIKSQEIDEADLADDFRLIENESHITRKIYQHTSAARLRNRNDLIEKKKCHKAYFHTEQHNGYSLSKLLAQLEAYDKMLHSGDEQAHFAQLYQIALELIEALRAIHAENIAHCDLKPENIIIDPITFKLKIIDFGLSRDLTKYESIISGGTPGYLPPEVQNRPNFPMDKPQDLYALGITLKRIFGYKFKQINGLPSLKAQSSTLVELPAHLEKLLSIMTHEDPAKRTYNAIEEIQAKFIKHDPKYPRAMDLINQAMEHMAKAKTLIISQSQLAQFNKISLKLQALEGELDTYKNSVNHLVREQKYKEVYSQIQNIISDLKLTDEKLSFSLKSIGSKLTRPISVLIGIMTDNTYLKKFGFFQPAFKQEVFKTQQLLKATPSLIIR